MTILEASDPELDSDPVPNVQIRPAKNPNPYPTKKVRIRNTGYDNPPCTLIIGMLYRRV
jgi:hypothetical protein